MKVCGDRWRLLWDGCTLTLVVVYAQSICGWQQASKQFTELEQRSLTGGSPNGNGYRSQHGNR